MGMNRWFYTAKNGRNRVRNLEIENFSCAFDHVSEVDWSAGERIVIGGKDLEFFSDATVSMQDLIADARANRLESCALTGWWQDHVQYLDEPEIKEMLLKDFTPKSESADADWIRYRHMIADTENSVSVHVRRGDYLKLPHVFHTLGKDYYRAAVAKVRETVQEPKFFVFSDDIPRVQSEDLFDVPVTYVETHSLLTDFQLSRSCQHNIIANSSYSWWAAYLNTNPHKNVVNPKLFWTIPEKQELYETSPRSLAGWHLV